MGTTVEKRERARLQAHEPAVQFPYHEDSNSSLGERTEQESLKEGGYHPVYIGEYFKNKTYTALCRLGVGHFSTVWLCLDNVRTAASGSATSSGPRRQHVVALKIQKSASEYSEAAKDEIKLLQAIRRKDTDAREPVISLLDHFEHFGPNGRHVCLVFEVLGCSLLKLVRRFNYKGAPIPLVRRIARHVLKGLHFLHTEANIIHTDLKPENVLFQIPSNVLEEIESQSTLFGKALEKRREEKLYGASSGTGTDRQNGLKNTSSRYRRNQRKRMKAKAKRAAERGTAIDSGNGVAREDEKVNLSGNGVSSRAVVGSGPGPATQRGVISADNTRNGERRTYGNDADLGSFDLGSIVNNDAMFASGVVQLADLGNACWTDRHFTEDIQTRQYRSPEVILGARYNSSVDIWSAACLIFELLTGDFLFDPHSGLEYDRDEDHLALMIELLGPMPKYLTKKGEWSRELFSRNGELKHIKRLDFFPLIEVLEEKYRYSKSDASMINSFLGPMLNLDPSQRATAKECLGHWFFSEKGEGNS